MPQATSASPAFTPTAAVLRLLIAAAFGVAVVFDNAVGFAVGVIGQAVEHLREGFKLRVARVGIDVGQRLLERLPVRVRARDNNFLVGHCYSPPSVKSMLVTSVLSI